MKDGIEVTIKGTKKDFDVLCTKTRYNIVKQKAKVKIDLDPYKPIIEIKKG